MVSSPHCIGNEESLMTCRFDPTYRNQVCSTYRNMVAMYVTCANGEMSNYTYHCGYKSPGACAVGRGRKRKRSGRWRALWRMLGDRE
jgi:hypothetical protein